MPGQRKADGLIPAVPRLLWNLEDKLYETGTPAPGFFHPEKSIFAGIAGDLHRATVIAAAIRDFNVPPGGVTFVPNRIGRYLADPRACGAKS